MDELPLNGLNVFYQQFASANQTRDWIMITSCFIWFGTLLDWVGVG